MLKKAQSFLPQIAAAILLVATAMIFLPGVVWRGTILGVDFIIDYSGLQSVFGQASDPEIKFSFGAFLGWLLLLASVVLSVVGGLNKKLGLLVLVAAGLALVGAVLVFFEAAFFNAANGVENFKLDVGPILGGIFGLLGAGAAGFAGVTALKSN